MSHHRNIMPLACALALGLLGAVAGPAAAAPGDLDPSFGVGGRVLSNTSPFAPDSARALAVQPDGKIIVAVRGQNGFNGPQQGPRLLVRYGRDGGLDRTFGTDGRVSTGDVIPEDVIVAPDGKLLVAGEDFPPQGGIIEFAVLRFGAGGSVDTSFGTAGKVISRFPSGIFGQPGLASDGIAKRVALQPDGKIVAAGEVCENSNGVRYRTIAIARYLADGSPDPDFSNDGLAEFGAGNKCFNDDKIGLALQPDGKVVTASDVNNGNLIGFIPSDFLVTRLTADGFPDTAFGDRGFSPPGTARTDVRGDNDVAHDVVIQPDGKIVVAGSVEDATGGGFAVVRYRSDGSLDPSFGGDGRVITESGGLKFAQAQALALQDDGRLVVGGCTERCGLNARFGAPESRFALARYATNGALDASFGAGGTVTTGFGPKSSYINDVAIQPGEDGGIVVAGAASDAVDGDFDVALARFAGKAVDLSVSASASADPVTVGGELAYTLTVANRGPDVAASVVLDDALSTRVDYVSSSASQGGCARGSDGRSVSCALGALASGASATVRVVVTATRTGTASNSASVSTPVPDAVVSNDSAVLTTTISQSPVSQPSAAGPGVLPSPAGPLSGAPPFAAKLEVVGARVVRSRRVLHVLALITGRASGRVRARFEAAGQTVSFDAVVDAKRRRVLIDRRLSAAQARVGSGILTLSYPGDGDTQPQEVRLRAASRAAGLRASRPAISADRLTASGTVGSLARGVVRLQVLFEPAGAPTRTLQFTAPIRGGRYRFDERLPAAVVAQIAQRRGVVHSYTLFTGYAPRQIRGEMTSFQIQGAR